MRIARIVNPQIENTSGRSRKSNNGRRYRRRSKIETAVGAVAMYCKGVASEVVVNCTVVNSIALPDFGITAEEAR